MRLPSRQSLNLNKSGPIVEMMGSVRDTVTLPIAFIKPLKDYRIYRRRHFPYDTGIVYDFGKKTPELGQEIR